MVNDGKKIRRIKIWIVLAVFVVTVVCSTVFSFYEIRQMKQAYAEKEYQIISSKVYDVTLNAMNKPIIASQIMANGLFLREVLEKEDEYTEEEMIGKMSRYLSDLKNPMHAQTAFVISEATKRYYTHEGLNKVIDVEKDEHDIWYSIFVNSKKSYDLDVDIDQVNNSAWTIFVNARIEDTNGEFLGVCGMGFAMDELQEILKEMEAEYGVKVNFVNSDGLVQVDTDAVNIENAYLYDVQYGKEKDGYAYRNKAGEYVVMRYVESLNWYLVVRGVGTAVTAKEYIPAILNGVIVLLVNTAVALALLNQGGKKEEKEDKEGKEIKKEGTE